MACVRVQSTIVDWCAIRASATSWLASEVCRHCFIAREKYGTDEPTANRAAMLNAHAQNNVATVPQPMNIISESTPQTAYPSQSVQPMQQSMQQPMQQSMMNQMDTIPVQSSLNGGDSFTVSPFHNSGSFHNNFMNDVAFGKHSSCLGPGRRGLHGSASKLPQQGRQTVQFREQLVRGPPAHDAE